MNQYPLQNAIEACNDHFNRAARNNFAFAPKKVATKRELVAEMLAELHSAYGFFHHDYVLDQGELSDQGNEDCINDYCARFALSDMEDAFRGCGYNVKAILELALPRFKEEAWLMS